MAIRKGDTVIVIAGKDKGKTGKVLNVDTRKGCVLVEKLNFVKRHQRPTAQYRQGGIVEKEAPIHISNVMYYEEKTRKGTRLGKKEVKGQIVRVSKRTGEVLESK